jgi:acyl transferase domain-containing protein
METERNPVALLLPGQGAQHVRMAAGLYGAEPYFTEAMDRVFELFGAGAWAGLRRDWLAQEPEIPIDDVRRSQPLLFAVNYAMGRQLLATGVRPAAILGHSVGELAGAVLAGILSVEDAVAVMRERVERSVAVPPGGMVAVSLAERDLRPLLGGHPEIVVAALNAPRQTVLAGPAAPLAAFADELTLRGVVFRDVPSRTPFHSPVMAPVAARPSVLDGIDLRPPSTPVWSAFTGGPLTAAQACDPLLWLRHPVAVVRFWPTLNALLNSGTYLVVEAGPGRGLALAARRHRSVVRGGSAVVALLPARPGPARADQQALRAGMARLGALVR